MKIVDINAYNIMHPLRETIQFSWEPYTQDFYMYTLVEVIDEEGFRGYSAVEFGPAYKKYLEGTVRMVLQGIDFDTPSDLARLLEVGSWLYMRLGPVEAAIWDLISKRENKYLLKTNYKPIRV